MSIFSVYTLSYLTLCLVGDEVGGLFSEEHLLGVVQRWSRHLGLFGVFGVEMSSVTYYGRPFTIVVEGNIGSGKSTFLKYLSGVPDVAVYFEPVDKWRNLNGINLLQLFYEDPGRHSLTFQSYAQLTMAEVHAARTDKPIKIMERSIWSSRHVFAELMLASGSLAASEFEVLNAWFEFLRRSPYLDFGVDLVIYLRTSPDVAYQRMVARGRVEESAVSVRHVQDVHDLYEKMVTDECKSDWFGGADVVCVDANRDMSSDPDAYSSILALVYSKITKRKAVVIT